jgi:hypothetical protein
MAHPDKQYGPLWSVAAAWVDINNDGLDLFVVNYLSWDGAKEPDCKYKGKPEYCHPKFYKETPSQSFLNNGNRKFTDISEQAGIRAHPGKGMSAAIADYDNDGMPDIFVTNDKLFNYLFHNKGHNRFEEVGLDLGVALPEHGNLISGMGCDFRDRNHDGYPDIALSALQNETFPLYQNASGTSFDEVTTRSKMTILSNPMSGYSVNIADFDNDGWKDIFVSRGDVASPNMADHLVKNENLRMTLFSFLLRFYYRLASKEFLHLCIEMTASPLRIRADEAFRRASQRHSVKVSLASLN